MSRRRRDIPLPQLDTGGIKSLAISFRKCLVDESVSESGIEHFTRVAKEQGLEFDCLQHIAVAYPGVQDVGILNELLDDNTCLFTADRALHNAALERGHTSYYFSIEGGLTDKAIPGIKPRGVLRKGVELNPKVDQLGSPELSPLYTKLVPNCARAQDKLRTKRRRIRNYFGGTPNMDAVAITLGAARTARSKLLIGVRIRISANSSGLKALDASERYILTPSIDPLAAYCHCLVQLILLELEKVPTTVYFDTETLEDPTEYSRSPHRALYRELALEFPTLEFIATPKGNAIQRLRSKLRALLTTKTNEIVEQDLPPLDGLFS